jgi:hypothetical protein
MTTDLDSEYLGGAQYICKTCTLCSALYYSCFVNTRVFRQLNAQNSKPDSAPTVTRAFGGV